MWRTFIILLISPSLLPGNLSIKDLKYSIFCSGLNTFSINGLYSKPYPAQRIKKAISRQIFVLEEGGKKIDSISFNIDSMFVLGDHIGLPRKVENLVLRYGEKISLGKKPYLASNCITILNYLLDQPQIKTNS